MQRYTSRVWCDFDGLTVFSKARSDESLAFSWHQAVGVGTRSLFFSNHPETLDAEPTPSILFKKEYVIPASEAVHVWAMLWHGNGNTQARTVHLVARNLGAASELTVSGHRLAFERGDTNNLARPSYCCSIPQVLGLQTLGGNPKLQINTDQALASYELVRATRLPMYVGAVHEFSVGGPPGSTFQLRTVFSNGPALGDHSSNCLSGSDSHPRGAWANCDILVTATPKDLGCLHSLQATL